MLPMNRTFPFRLRPAWWPVLLFVGLVPGIARAQEAPPAEGARAVQQAAAIDVDVPPVDSVGRFDLGKMWTFDNPPLDYFEEAYGFRPDSAWFRRARLGALRIPGCSASFVSPAGLVMTNHHCVREYVTKVSRPGETLLDDGFYAASLDEERAVEGVHADQLIAIEDVTDRIVGDLTRIRSDRQAEMVEQRVERLAERMTAAAKMRDTTLFVEIIALYDGGQYSAYTFKRFHDVRLVMAPEVQIGFFGGDLDNFTYPRYNLDVSFLRIYQDGAPYEPEVHFPFNPQGAGPGEAVFVVGNPGTTSRLNTLSQLLFERDYDLPYQLDALRRRAALLAEYLAAHPEDAERYDLRNTYFSMMNSIKAYTGQLEGLKDPDLLAARLDNERQLRRAIQSSDSLRALYGDVFDRIEDLQQAKKATVRQGAALLFYTTSLGSHVLTRAAYGYLYDRLRQRNYPAPRLADIRKDALKVEDLPPDVEEALIRARLEDLQTYLGPNDPTLRRVLAGRTIEETAAYIAHNTALIDTTGFVRLLDEGFLNSGDPTVVIAEALTPLYFTLGQQQSSFEEREKALNARLARARFAIYGKRFPPDATFSLRISDGVVRGYPYNGTQAPAFTTFYGLYDRFNTFGPGTDWALPPRWTQPAPGFEPATPLNLVTTNDITGGNSGSPLLNRDLEVVGLIFDSNIEALPNEYLYTDETARAVAVDVRGILEALDDVYDADRLVLELTSGRVFATEAEADAAMAQD